MVKELRTPLTVLRGYIEVFEDEFADKFNEEQKAFMAKMTSSAAQLSMFVNNILNVARIDSDQMHVVPKMENWVDIVKQAAQDFALRASVRNRKILIKIHKELPKVAVDRVSVYKILINLVDNVIK